MAGVLDIGVVLPDPPAATMIERAVTAESLGFRYFWTFDSVVMWQEPFVIYSQILARTSSLIVGPMVTNPVTRDWSVTASLFATLNDLYGPRTICGMGRGGSAVHMIGRPQATLGELAGSVDAIRSLAAGEAVTLRGQTVRMPWVTTAGPEVWVAGYGPKALAIAGRHADGLILQMADPDLVAWAIDIAREAAQKAGRDPDALKVCVAAPAYVSEDRTHQRNQCRWFGGMVDSFMTNVAGGYRSQPVPAALTNYLAAKKGYDEAAAQQGEDYIAARRLDDLIADKTGDDNLTDVHNDEVGNPGTAFVPDEIVDRFCILGTTDEHIAKLAELQALGVNQVALYLIHDHIDQTMAAYGETIIPKVATAVSA